MNMCEISLAGTSVAALGSGALWWAEESLLVVSDMHLGKSDRMARRRGPLLPPYETRATLEKLAADLEATGAARVISLGDSFDDDLGVEALEAEDHALLLGLIAGRAWTWISGNHDPAPIPLGGACCDELVLGGLVFRHIAEDVGGAFEVSGHYHPKLSLVTRAGMITRAAFVWDEARMILPAYGAYTGGLNVKDPALRGLFAATARAVLTGVKPVVVPAFPSGAARSRTRWQAGPPPRRLRGSSG